MGVGSVLTSGPGCAATDGVAAAGSVALTKSATGPEDIPAVTPTGAELAEILLDITSWITIPADLEDRHCDFSFLIEVTAAPASEEDSKVRLGQSGTGKRGPKGMKLESKGDFGNISYWKNDSYSLMYSEGERKFYMRNTKKNEQLGSLALGGLALVAGSNWSFLETLVEPLIDFAGGKFAANRQPGAKQDRAGRECWWVIWERKPADVERKKVVRFKGANKISAIEGFFLREKPNTPVNIRYLTDSGSALSNFSFSTGGGVTGKGGHASGMSLDIQGAPELPAFRCDIKVERNSDGAPTAIRAKINPSATSEIAFTTEITWLEKGYPDRFTFRPPSGSTQMDIFDFSIWLADLFESFAIQ